MRYFLIPMVILIVLFYAATIIHIPENLKHGHVCIITDTDFRCIYW